MSPGPARGCLYGLIASAALWALIAIILIAIGRAL